MKKRIEFKVYMDITNSYIQFDDIEAFLLHNFTNFGDVQRVDLIDITDAETGKQIKEPEYNIPF